MTIFRSKPRELTFKVTNSSKEPLHLMTELWCDEFNLQPGETLEATAPVKDLSDPVSPLDFEIFLEDGHVSLWCPYGTKFVSKEAKAQ